MEQISEAHPSLALHGIQLSVMSEKQDCVFEIQGGAGQLAILRRILDVCRQEFGMHFEKESYIPQIILEPWQTEWGVSKEIKIALVEPATPTRPILLHHYVSENFRGNEYKSYIYSDLVKDRIRKNGRKIRVEMREISTQNFPWEQMADYLANADMIVLAVNATDQAGDSIEAIKTTFNKIVQYFSYPEAPLLLAGVRFERGKSPRREAIEALAESLGVPYVECFKNREMRVSEIIEVAINSVLYNKIPRYKFHAVCKNVKRDVFVDPDFYRKLNQKITESFPLLNLSWGEPRLALYRRVGRYLEAHEQYAALLQFHLAHCRSKIIYLQNEAHLSLLHFSKSPLAVVAFDKIRQELENNSVEMKEITETLKGMCAYIHVPIYSLILSVSFANFNTLCELLRDNKSLVNVTLVFKFVLSTEMLDKLGAVLMSCTALRHLKFAVQTEVRIREYKSFRDVFASHPTLLSLDFSECRLSQANVAEIVESVSRSATVLRLNLAGNYVNDEAIRAVKYLLQHTTSLHQLDISNSQLGLSTLSRILSVMRAGTSLTELNVSRNKLSELGVVHLLKGLTGNSPLRILNVSQCSMTFRGMSVLLTGLHAAPLLTTVSVAGYDFGKNNLDLLLTVIRQNKVLQNVDLSQCGLYMGSLFRILESLQYNPVLRKIDLSRNHLSDDGAKLLFDFLERNKTLECLSLNETAINDAGLIVIADLLRSNTSLKQLYLRGNRYSHASISVLLSALSKNTTLFSLDVGESVTDKIALDYLMGFITENTRIRALGFMPKQAQRTVDLLTLYENAFLGNRTITSTHQDFNCRCGRCLCVKARKIVSWVEDNKLNRYKNMVLLIKAYFNPAEDSASLLAFKRIPKDVVWIIFRMAYPELPQKVLSSISGTLFFRPPRVGMPSRENNRSAQPHYG